MVVACDRHPAGGISRFVSGDGLKMEKATDRLPPGYPTRCRGGGIRMERSSGDGE
jgi:hypothetical protein